MKDELIGIIVDDVRKWAYPIVRHRVPDDFEDILSIVIGDLWSYIDRNKNGKNFTLEEAKKIASNIIRWRVADHYRSSIFNTNFSSDTDELSSEEISIPKSIHIQDVLSNCIKILTNYPEDDREIILRVLAQKKGNTSMNPSERQRLSRLRSSLKRDLEKFYGVSICELLSDD